MEKSSNIRYFLILKLGTVTSVALTVPSIFTVTGSPITSSGTLAISTTATPTGTGPIVLQTSPTFITPTLGAASGTSLNLSSLTASYAVHTDASKNLVSVQNSGTGLNILQTSPTLITPNIGVASGTSINLSSLSPGQLVITDSSKNLVSFPQGNTNQVLTSGVTNTFPTSNYVYQAPNSSFDCDGIYPVGTLALFQGFVPDSINGLRTVVATSGQIIRVAGQLGPVTTYGTVSTPGVPTWANPATSGIFIY